MAERPTDRDATASTGMPDRRTILRGVAFGGAAAVAGPLLAACSGATSPGAAGSGGTGSGGSGGAHMLGPASAVPLGEGKIYAEQRIVVTQPTRGDFKGFSAICTHQGCVLANVSGGTINCECHGSAFSVKDGSVVNGPATQPLPRRPITVEHGQIRTP